MTKKVKVSKEVAEAIEKALNYFLLADGGEDPEEALIVQHAFELHGEVERKMLADVLFELGTFELAEILVNGYEVEQTPEEKIQELYTEYNNLYESTPSEENEDQKYLFARNAIIEVLDILGMRIKGVSK